ncbi:MAG: hypothetical protein HY796_12180 [Elusimicrobia bacterium]|nr:hypothetical protein [Elusimicrobiota bacterium]
MKNQMRCLTALLAVCMLAGHAWAANSDDVALSVTVSNSVSVTLPTATYDFASVALGGQSVNTSALGVDNDSGGIREDYSLSMVDSAGGWTAVTGVPSTDQYAIQAVFASTQPAHADFAANDDLDDGLAAAAAGDTAFAVDGWVAADKGYDAKDRAGTHERTLWLRLRMPSDITVSQSNPFATVWVSAAAG